MALPAALSAALSRARSLGAISSAFRSVSASSDRGCARPTCVSACLGCAACSLVAAFIAVSLGTAFLAVTTSLVRLGSGSGPSCLQDAVTSCTTLTNAIVGAPMTCAGLYVSQGFGDTPWEHPHAGIDIVCPPATVVVAVASGVFRREQGAPIACRFPAGRSGGLGLYAELEAGGRTFLYGHLEGFAAANDTQVVAGQPLGFEGATGCATGYHLHFEVLEDGKPVDPCPTLPANYPDPHDPTGRRCWGTAPP